MDLRGQRSKALNWHLHGDGKEIYLKQSVNKQKSCGGWKKCTSRLLAWGFLARLWAHESSIDGYNYISDNSPSFNFLPFKKAHFLSNLESAKAYSPVTHNFTISLIPSHSDGARHDVFLKECDSDEGSSIIESIAPVLLD